MGISDWSSDVCSSDLARIAFAERGGRINTDFIDNSAGVDCSDNEVNIKIALNREVMEGRLALAQRTKLLTDMTDDVAGLEIGRAHVRPPVTNAHLVCRLLLETKQTRILT